MKEVVVGRESDFGDADRKVVSIDGVEVGVFRLNGQFTAYMNYCPHLGGPACQGALLPRTIVDLSIDNVDMSRRFSKSKRSIVCPWHGMEFDVATGLHVTSPTLHLTKVPVRIDGGDVILTIEERS